MIDTHVYSICFLFRQCIELELKEDLWMTEYARTGIKIYRDEAKGPHKKHELGPIWKRLRTSAMQLLGPEFPLTVADSSYISEALSAWERHDRNSYSFRYPISLKGGRTLTALNHVNVVALRDSVDHLLELLGRVVYCVGYFYDEQLTNKGD